MRTENKNPLEVEADRTLDKRLVLLLAATCGLVVANLYYAQPLLDLISREFRAGTTSTGLAVTVTQFGYAAGLLLVVPLGDVLECRRLVTVILLGTALSLVLAALSPTIEFFVAISFLVGLTSVVVQILLPAAAGLAREVERGQVVGTVQSGLLIGVLLSRTLSGLVAQAAGWRSIYWIAAALMLVLSFALRSWLPPSGPDTSMPYPSLLHSVASLIREEPLLRLRSAYGALVFAAFSVFWTSVAFLLARPPYGYSEVVIGLFGLVGVAGAVAASFAGRLADRGWQFVSTGAFLGAILLSFGPIALGARQLMPLLVGVVLMDFGVQGVHSINQSVIYRSHAAARSRIATVYMTTYFVGGAVGSAASAAIFGADGWMGVSALGAAFAAAAVALWLADQAPHKGGLRA